VQTNIEGVLISLSERLIFQDGQAELPADAYPVLDMIAAMLRPIDNKVRLVGHTNSIPSSNPLYPTNWELSLGRALSVAKYLMNAGISADRFMISGSGEYDPLFPNDTPGHLSLNARVEIVIVYPVEQNMMGVPSPEIVP
jgi:chemotaxis protein MotB